MRCCWVPVILQLNSRPGATTLPFMEELLNFFSNLCGSGRLWMQVVTMNFYLLWISVCTAIALQELDTNLWFPLICHSYLPYYHKRMIHNCQLHPIQSQIHSRLIEGWLRRKYLETWSPASKQPFQTPQDCQLMAHGCNYFACAVVSNHRFL